MSIIYNVLNILENNMVKNSEIELNEKIFNVKENKQAISKAVNLYLANKRQATAKTKTRSEVSGGGKKPWRQKGTGRARAGSIRSPIWVGGGNVFGPKNNQNFKLKQNRKEYFLALTSILTSKRKKNELIIINDIYAKKTKEIVTILKKLNSIKKKNLIIVNNLNRDLILATNNIKNVVLKNFKQINVYDIINANNLIITIDAIKNINNFSL